jgi:hypothetical protein
VPVDEARTDDAESADQEEPASSAGIAWLPGSAAPVRSGRDLRIGAGAVALLALGVVGIVLCCGLVLRTVDKVYPHRTPTPNVSSPALLKARAEAARSLGRTIASVPIASAITLGEGSDEACFRGEHGLKIRDNFNHVCTTRRTVFYGVPVATLRASVIDVGDQLFSDGWRAAPDSVLAVLTEDSQQASNVPRTSFAAEYTRGADRLVLRFGPVDRPELRTSGFSQQNTDSASGDRYWEGDHEVTGTALAAALKRSSGGALVVLSIQRAWFHD